MPKGMYARKPMREETKIKISQSLKGREPVNKGQRKLVLCKRCGCLKPYRVKCVCGGFGPGKGVLNGSSPSIPWANAKQYSADYQRFLKYKLSPEDFLILLKKQDGRCAICRESPSGNNSLRVDHDHNCCPGKLTCGKCVRGLLCINCNRSLERLDKDRQWANKATEYINSARYNRESLVRIPDSARSS